MFFKVYVIVIITTIIMFMTITIIIMILTYQLSARLWYKAGCRGQQIGTTVSALS